MPVKKGEPKITTSNPVNLDFYKKISQALKSLEKQEQALGMEIAKLKKHFTAANDQRMIGKIKNRINKIK